MLQNETLTTIKRSASIPSIPMVATRCYELTQDPNCNADDLVKLLSTDPGIAASILRLANSALFGVTREVGTLQQAIALLGMRRIRELVLARYLVHKMEDAGSDLIELDYYWRRSLLSGILATKFASAALLPVRDEAFMGGLLSDVGVIVLAKSLPDTYASIAKNYQPHGTEDWLQAEYNLLGVTHGEVSALVLEQWGLPESLVEAVKHHHTSAADMPEDCAGHELARILNAAGAIAKLLCETTDAEAAIETCLQSLQKVELDPSVLLEALSDLEQEVNGMAELLGLNILSSKVFSAIGGQLAEHLKQIEAPMK
ncbi:MAG: HDOD domain-containing protein [Phycisphaerales bacterium]|nr:HDOD domain-containing protein [Phycisphaerales bacterium]